jgi:hypothetical protein
MKTMAFFGAVALTAAIWAEGPSGAEEGFTSLFDGKSLTGWTNAQGGEPGKGWVIEDGSIARKGMSGDLFTAKEYGDFDFRFEWKIAPGGNSGVKYRVMSYDGKILGPEYQVLDDERHPDAKIGSHRQAAALYDILPAEADKKSLKPVGEWNESRIVCQGAVLQHWLNGVKALEVDTSSEAFAAAVAKSKFKSVKDFAKNTSGRIMLQDHMDPVWFRNLRIKELGAAAPETPAP